MSQGFCFRPSQGDSSTHHSLTQMSLTLHPEIHKVLSGRLDRSPMFVACDMFLLNSNRLVNMTVIQ